MFAVSCAINAELRVKLSMCFTYDCATPCYDNVYFVNEFSFAASKTHVFCIVCFLMRGLDNIICKARAQPYCNLTRVRGQGGSVDKVCPQT